MWHVAWPEISTSDHYLVEIGGDDRVLPDLADLLLPLEDEFGLALRLPDEGAILELIDPLGCLVDTANMGAQLDEGWLAGSATLSASMERTDLFAEEYPRTGTPT